MERKEKKIRVAISQGDINGVSWEILLKLFTEERILELFTPIVFGTKSAFEYWANSLSIDTQNWVSISSLSQVKEDKVNLIEVAQTREVVVEPGKPTELAGQLAFWALEEATKSVLSGAADLLVTGPINKSVMPKDLFPYPGHTQYLEAKACRGDKQSLMLMCAGDCRVALVTDHIPLNAVSVTLTEELITQKVKMLEQGLIQDFGIVKPRIALLALNPHAGDNGVIGREELELIKPTIDKLFEQGHIVFGPYSADGFWASGRVNSFDGVVAMYHDQGLAPFKTLYMDEGVNVTLGLSIVRTSPDHGTGYDIAGQGIASPTSFRQAIYTGIDILRSRHNYEWANRNPLRRVYFNKGRDDESLDLSSEESY